MIRLFIAIAFLLASFVATAQEKVIRVNDNGTDPNANYAIKMIQLANEHLDNKYKIEINKEQFSQSRTNEEVKNNGRLNVFWSGSEATLEEKFQPVRIPLFKGLLGYRIFIIHKKNQYKFDQIKTIEDLKKLKLAQGTTWADTKILLANGFNIVKVHKYPNIFYMVDGERVDGFPRGVHEPFGELALRPELPDLTVENQLMLAYRMPFYLLTSHENKSIADDLTTGLERAIADGSFDKTFINDPRIKDVIEKANMKNRKVFYIDNPLLSKETPLQRAELWFDPKAQL